MDLALLAIQANAGPNFEEEMALCYLWAVISFCTQHNEMKGLKEKKNNVMKR